MNNIPGARIAPLFLYTYSMDKEWAEKQWGDLPSDELFDLVHRASFDIQAIANDPDLYFRNMPLDMVRLVIQAKLLDIVSEAIRIDRLSEPNFFGSIPQTFGYTPRQPRQQPPLRSWIRRNGRRHIQVLR